MLGVGRARANDAFEPRNTRLVAPRDIFKESSILGEGPNDALCVAITSAGGAGLCSLDPIRKVGPANASPARYDGLPAGAINPGVMLSPLTNQEAVLSSKVEGAQKWATPAIPACTELLNIAEGAEGAVSGLSVVGHRQGSLCVPHMVFDTHKSSCARWGNHKTPLNEAQASRWISTGLFDLGLGPL